MTLTVALRGRDGLVIAADSRGTIGDPRGLTAVNDSYTKILKLSDYCGIAIAGASELAAKVVDELEVVLGRKKLRFADEILDETRKLVRMCYDDWFAKFALQDRPSLGFTLVGYQMVMDDYIPRTYSIVSKADFAPQLSPNGNMLQGVPQYALYLMHRFYSHEMNVSNTARLAAYLIAETATQDPKVGGPIRIATITPNEGYQELEPSIVEEIVAFNNEQSEKLRQFFLGG